MRKYWNKVAWRIEKKKKNNFYESNLLHLNVSKVKKQIRWKSILTLNETIKMVIEWYKNYYLNPKNIYITSINQIKKYENLLKKRSIR